MILTEDIFFLRKTDEFSMHHFRDRRKTEIQNSYLNIYIKKNIYIVRENRLSQLERVLRRKWIEAARMTTKMGIKYRERKRSAVIWYREGMHVVGVRDKGTDDRVKWKIITRVVTVNKESTKKAKGNNYIYKNK